MIFLGIGGLVLSAYILYIKLSNKTMVCPTGSDCNKVIFSRYSNFFGIPLEYLGIFYYAFIIFLYSTLILYPGIVPESVIFGALLITAGAFLFSLYLTSIQAFALKQWCMWCLLSAALSTTIFIVSFGKLSFGLSFLTTALPWIFTIHFLALALGVGGVTLVIALFFRFLRDLRISGSELSVIKIVFEAIWFSLAIFTLTEFAIYMTSPEAFISSPQFLAKIFVLAFLVILSVIINLIVMPMLTAIDFGEKKNANHKEFVRMRGLSFGLGAIYVTSWYFVFIIDVMPTMSVEFSNLMTIYTIFGGVSLLLGGLTNHLVSNRARNTQR